MRHIIIGRAFRRADFSVYRLELWASSSVDPARVCEFPGKQESSGNTWPRSNARDPGEKLQAKRVLLGAKRSF
jgi:hypothetical protein